MRHLSDKTKIIRETGLTETDAVALLGAHTVGKVGGFDFLKPMDSNGSLVNHHHHWDNMYYKILSEDMTWHSINHKPLSIAFGLKDKNGDGVLTINSEEHVKRTKSPPLTLDKLPNFYHRDNLVILVSIGGNSDIDGGSGHRRHAPTPHL